MLSMILLLFHQTGLRVLSNPKDLAPVKNERNYLPLAQTRPSSMRIKCALCA